MALKDGGLCGTAMITARSADRNKRLAWRKGAPVGFDPEGNTVSSQFSAGVFREQSTVSPLGEAAAMGPGVTAPPDTTQPWAGGVDEVSELSLSAAACL